MPTVLNRKAMTRLEAKRRVETAYAIASVLIGKTKPATRRDVAKQLLFFKTAVLLEMQQRLGVRY
jgi:hypothetical protein